MDKRWIRIFRITVNELSFLIPAKDMDRWEAIENDSIGHLPQGERDTLVIVCAIGSLGYTTELAPGTPKIINVETRLDERAKTGHASAELIRLQILVAILYLIYGDEDKAQVQFHAAHNALLTHSEPVIKTLLGHEHHLAQFKDDTYLNLHWSLLCNARYAILEHTIITILPYI